MILVRAFNSMSLPNIQRHNRAAAPPAALEAQLTGTAVDASMRVPPLGYATAKYLKCSADE